MSDTATPTETGARDNTANHAKTEYVILRRGDQPGPAADWDWTHVTKIEASNPEAAVRKHGKEGIFVAIPARSWKPVTVTAKQTVTLELKPAS